MDTRAIERAITRRTIGIVGSAPQYPHGVVDPIGELGAIAQRHKLPLHVDACVGGWMLPWLERLRLPGHDIPKWDFRVPGVTSISADLHKYAYASKGASVLLWRSMDDMKYQIFVATEFPGGIYASPTMLGTRPGGPIAAAWASLHALGDAGFLALTKTAMDAADRLRAGIAAIPDLALVGRPDATIVCYRAAGNASPGFAWARSAAKRSEGTINIYAIADRMEARGWTVDRQHRPPTIHLTVTANHVQVVESYLSDLRASVSEVRTNPALAKSGSAPMYGMAGKLPVRFMVKRQVRALIAKMYSGRGDGGVRS